jgi:hypothetical protein
MGSCDLDMKLALSSFSGLALANDSSGDAHTFDFNRAVVRSKSSKVNIILSSEYDYMKSVKKTTAHTGAQKIRHSVFSFTTEHFTPVILM